MDGNSWRKKKKEYKKDIMHNKEETDKGVDQEEEQEQ